MQARTHICVTFPANPCIRSSSKTVATIMFMHTTDFFPGFTSVQSHEANPADAGQPTAAQFLAESKGSKRTQKRKTPADAILMLATYTGVGLEAAGQARAVNTRAGLHVRV